MNVQMIIIRRIKHKHRKCNRYILHDHYIANQNVDSLSSKTL